MEYIAEIKNLNKSYGKRTALDDIDINIERGKIIGLLGSNGSGKTTLIKLMSGLLVPTSGEILINGKPVGIESKKIVSYLPERTYLSSWTKVKDAVSTFEIFYDDFNKQKAYQMFKKLNINLNDRLRTMSKGTREKIQLILVMSREAGLYLLDEPIGGVDPASRDYILNTIIRNYNPESTVIISTHLISDIENILDDVIFLREGKIFLNDSVENVREKNGKSVDAYFREVFAC